jgi:hypothetical protein
MEVLPEKNTDEKEKKLLSIVEAEEPSIEYFTKAFLLAEKKTRPDDLTYLLWRMPISNS